MDIVELKQKDIPAIRKKLFEDQNGICPICKKTIIDPVLDHSHQKKNNGTGLCRATLCRNCNSMTGVAENRCLRYGIKNEDLPMVLRNIADYLEAPHTNYLHPKESRKITQDEYSQIKIYYFLIYPKRRKLPDRPKGDFINKEYKQYFKEIKEYIKKNGKRSSGRIYKNSLKKRDRSKS